MLKSVASKAQFHSEELASSIGVLENASFRAQRWIYRIAKWPHLREGCSKMEPQRVPKVDKIDAKNGTWKRLKILEKTRSGAGEA